MVRRWMRGDWSLYSGRTSAPSERTCSGRGDVRGRGKARGRGRGRGRAKVRKRDETRSRQHLEYMNI